MKNVSIEYLDLIKSTHKQQKNNIKYKNIM